MRQQLSEAQWKRIERLLPGKVGDPGRSGADNRLFVEAVLWIARTGSPWRDLPEEFGSWNSTYQRFARWSRAGVWHSVFSELARERRFREVIIDSTIIRAHQHAAGAPKKTAPRRSRSCEAAQCGEQRHETLRVDGATQPQPGAGEVEFDTSGAGADIGRGCHRGWRRRCIHGCGRVERDGQQQRCRGTRGGCSECLGFTMLPPPLEQPGSR